MHRAAFGLVPFLRARQNIFSVRTSHPVNNIYLFLPLLIEFKRGKIEGRRSHGGRGGGCPCCQNGAGAARGQQVALFD